MKAFHSDLFVLPLPDGHRFPMAKYRRLRERVTAELPDVELLEPPAATDGVLALGHAPDWIERLTLGRLAPAEERSIGLPWSPAMVERSRRSVGATIAACRAALQDGAAANLAGGTHHAGPDRGEGFCCLNDVAVAARLMQAERRARRVAIVDLDVHQGNGTARILRDDPSVFTLSLHGARNFPFRGRCAGDLDVELPDGTGDDAYLDALERALRTLAARFVPDLIVYLAGADVWSGDRLGRLSLTAGGVAERDRRVFEFAHERGLPVAVAMGGGYGDDVEAIVGLHLATVREALAHAHRRPGAGARPSVPPETRP